MLPFKLPFPKIPKKQFFFVLYDYINGKQLKKTLVGL
jgi:hypothetical protein